MSQENVEIVRRGYERFAATGDFLATATTVDFVWDMSKFRGWPEQQTYEGVEGVRTFQRAAGGYGLRPGLDPPRWQVGPNGNVCGPVEALEAVGLSE